MSTTFFPGNLQWFGLAKETTYGTAVAAPNLWVPIVDPKWEPKITPLPDDALRGMMGTPFGQQQGLRFEQISYKTYLYMDTVFPHIVGICGRAATVTGSSDPWTQKTALYNGSGTDNAQPASYTGFYFDGTGACWQIPGMVIGEAQLSIKAEEPASIQATWMGLPATKMVSAPTNTPSTVPFMPSWNTAITVGGTALQKYSEVTFDYKRDAQMIPTITGSQTPFAIYSGELTATGSLTAIYQGSADNDLTSYLTNAQPTLVVQIAPVGDATHSLKLTHSKVAYDVAAAASSGKWMEVTATIKGLMNTTDALGGGMSPFQATLLTATSTAF